MSKTTTDIEREQEKLAALMPLARLVEVCADASGHLARLMAAANAVRDDVERGLPVGYNDAKMKELLTKGWSPDAIMRALEHVRASRRNQDAGPTATAIDPPPHKAPHEHRGWDPNKDTGPA